MENKKAILNRIKKIKGQIAGVEKMIDQNRSCAEIIQQLKATQSATKSAIIRMLKDEICRSVSAKKGDQFEKSLKLLFKFN